MSGFTARLVHAEDRFRSWQAEFIPILDRAQCGKSTPRCFTSAERKRGQGGVWGTGTVPKTVRELLLPPPAPSALGLDSTTWRSR